MDRVKCPYQPVTCSVLLQLEAIRNRYLTLRQIRRYDAELQRRDAMRREAKGFGMGKLDGRVVLVTGAARGQGEQEARLFREEGAEVAVADVLDDQGRDLAKELGALYVHLDVGREGDWESAVDGVTEAYGRIDGLVNNAGILRFNTLIDTPLDEFMRIVEVNQVGCFLGIKSVAAGWPTGARSSTPPPTPGVTGTAAVGAYAASKHAILGLYPGRRPGAGCPEHPGQRHVPGCHRHRDVQPRAHPDRRKPRHQEEGGKGPGPLLPQARAAAAIGGPGLARLALFLTGDDSSYITGQPFVIDGGWLAGVNVV
ncbi:Glucose 1-dehydrogenase OS=Streptomyces alboniger OX=132473 GN=CP975_15050 PE=3 SV=1 [Streptomyces alboniger]